MLLQNAAFLPMFRQSMHGRGKVRDFQLDALKPAPAVPTGPAAVDAIFAQVGGNSMAAAEMTLAYFLAGEPSKPWVERAQDLVIHKAAGAHDFKFGFAALEDLDYISEKWRPHYAAASVFQLQGASRSDNPLIERTREALEAC
jgi:hypothetical protein